MSRYQVKDYGDIPVPHDQRIRTDIFCTICSSLFAIILFIISIALLNTENLSKMTYPNDNQGNLCGWGQSQDYKILYYTTLSDPTKRLCVSQCPKSGDTQLKCFATPNLSCAQNSNPKYEVQVYDSVIETNRLGLFCVPTNDEGRQKVEQMSGMYNKKRFLSSYDSIWNSLWLGFIFGSLFLVLAQLFPVKVFHWSYIIGGIVFILAGILIMILPESNFFWKFIVGALFIFLGIMVLFNVAKQQRRRQIIVGGRILECATEVLKTNYFMVLYIIGFIIAFGLLLLLVGFELLAVWSSGSLVFKPETPYYQVQGFVSNVLSFFIFLELIWGMSFLKQAFNFCVSGYATQWYYFQESQPQKVGMLNSLKLLLKYHWGSVVGGSLMLQFFYIPDFIGDYFFGTDVNKRSGTASSRINQSEYQGNMGRSNLEASRAFTGETQKDPRKCSFCCEFLNLVRSQSMGYINVVSIPYCNASRYCQMMAQDSNFYDRSQTTNRLFRLSAHAILIGMAGTLSILISRQHEGHNTLIGTLFVFMVSLFIVTYFVSFHGDLAEGLLVSAFIEQKVKRLSDGLQRPPECMKKIYNEDVYDKLKDTGLKDFLI